MNICAACGEEVSWVSVGDRMPEHGVNVLVWWRPIDHEDRPFHREVIVASLNLNDIKGGSGLWWANGRYYDSETFITHWMPLPSPPKEST